MTKHSPVQSNNLPLDRERVATRSALKAACLGVLLVLGAVSLGACANVTPLPWKEPGHGNGTK